MASTSELTLALKPEHRFDVIDVNARIRQRYGDVLDAYRRVLYCSYHTTAGYLEQGLGTRLNGRESVHDFLAPFQHLFPPGANYRHDQLALRTELSDEERLCEPRNADSHLTFIGSGLEPCVTYENRPGAPVYFIDLDGVNRDAAHGPQRRHRQTTVIGYDREERAERVRLRIPVSAHPIDSINLKDPSLGVFERLNALVRRHGIRKGRIDLHLGAGEEHAGLTVNEDETLLMAHDLREVLQNPMRFMAEKSWGMLRDPRAVPGKMKMYAKYDLVLVVNKLIDKLGLSGSLAERVIDKFLAVPAERYLRMKRSVSLLVSDAGPDGRGIIVQGRYQSPILVQWQKAPGGTRHLDAVLSRFE